MAESNVPVNVNDFCRLCNALVRKGIDDRVTATKRIYQREAPDNKSIYTRLASYGLFLQPRDDKSIRICRKCHTKVKSMEESLSTLNKWKLSEVNPAETTTPRSSPPQTDSERSKRLRESPSKTPRAAKRQRHHSGTPNRKSTPLKTPGKAPTATGTRQSVVEVRMYFFPSIY